jgi:hypothetical protein
MGGQPKIQSQEGGMQMKSRTIVATALLLCSTGLMADTTKPLDTSQLKAPIFSILLPQQMIFVEPVVQGNMIVVPGNALAWNFAPSFIIGDLIGNKIAQSGAFDEAQSMSYQLHYMMDGYDAEPMLRQGLSEGLKSVSWLKPMKVVESKEDSDSVARLTSSNQGNDSTVTLLLYYSTTPDYRGLVVAAQMKVYSRALSPEKANPYDPDSRYAWLKQPVAIRTCIYQSKLLDLPEKTPEVMQQLTAIADKEFNIAKLKRDAAAMDPYSTPISERSSIEAGLRNYNAVTRAIQNPRSGLLDSQLMYGVLWTADDAALFKQTIHDGAVALADLLSRSMAAPQEGATLVTNDPRGKNSLYSIDIPPDRTALSSTAGVALSFQKGDKPDIGAILMP